MSRRWRYAARPRDRRWDPPFTTPTAAAEPPPRFVQQRTRWNAGVRRGEFQAVPPQVAVAVSQVPPAMARARRPWSTTSRPGVFASPPWPQETPPTPPVWVAQHVRPSTRRTGWVRRGAFQLVPKVGAVPAISVVPPKMLRQSTRLVFGSRSGVFHPLVPTSSFVCQDFITTVGVVAHSATVDVVAYSTTATAVAYSATALVVTDDGTATICGR